VCSLHVCVFTQHRHQGLTYEVFLFFCYLFWYVRVGWTGLGGTCSAMEAAYLGEPNVSWPSAHF